jgi:hypothetical protein
MFVDQPGGDRVGRLAALACAAIEAVQRGRGKAERPLNRGVVGISVMVPGHLILSETDW